MPAKAGETHMSSIVKTKKIAYNLNLPKLTNELLIQFFKAITLIGVISLENNFNPIKTTFTNYSQPTKFVWMKRQSIHMAPSLLRACFGNFMWQCQEMLSL